MRHIKTHILHSYYEEQPNGPLTYENVGPCDKIGAMVCHVTNRTTAYLFKREPVPHKF